MLWLGRSPVGFQLWKVFENKHFMFRKRDFRHFSPCSFHESKNYQLFQQQWFLTKISASSGTYFKCFLMDVTNLAQPYWNSVPCYSETLGDVVCQQNERSVKGSAVQSSIDLNVCSAEQILNNTKCFMVVWENANFCDSSCSTFADDVTMTRADSSINFSKQFSFLLEASSFQLTPLVVQKSNSLLVLEHDKFLQTYKPSYVQHSYQVSGFRINVSNSFHAYPGDMIFACTDNVFISVYFICDGHNDCSNGDPDEQFCNCSEQNHVYPRYLETNGACEPVFQKMVETNSAELLAGQLETNLSLTHSKKFSCQDGTKIDFSMVDDFVGDCGMAEDEQILIHLIPEAHIQNCVVQNDIPCASGHTRCYHIYQLCLYAVNGNGHLSPCRNGGHIQSCTYFECNLKFKCPNSYCIPWHYVCDGKIDCPKLDDESDVCQATLWCAQMLLCHKARNCVHIGSVCDGHQDCPLGDDELVCQLKTIICPEFCNCVALTVVCSSESSIFFNQNSYPYVYASISSRALVSIEMLHVFQGLVFLRLKNTSITSICQHISLQDIIFLSVRSSPLKVIQHRCFLHQRKIIALKLINDNIQTLEKWSMADLANLTLLNLSHNCIKVIPEITPYGVTMKVLSLYGNSLSMQSIKGLHHFNILKIETFKYSLCCGVQDKTHCHVTHPWYISCSDLLSSHTKIVYIVASFITLGSTTLVLVAYLVIWYKHRRTNSACYNLIVISICADHSLFEIYLFGIWNAAVFYNSIFVEYEAIWRKSSICVIFSSLLSFHSFSAPALAFYLSLTRLMVVKYPIETKFKLQSFCQRCLFVILLLGSSFVVVVLMFSWNSHRIVSNVLCFPFIDPSHSYVAVRVLTYLSSSFQIGLSLVVSLLNIQLVVTLRSTQSKIGRHCSKVDRSKAMLIQLAVLSISSILCSCTSNTIYLTSHSIEEYSIDLMALTISLSNTTNIVVINCVFFATTSRSF